jgi:Lon protease-like protein
MNFAQSRLEDLPESFPVFPLADALLLPGGQLPLNIFEPRYMAMTEDALARGRLLGMIQPDLSRPAVANGPALFRVGCLGRLSSFAETDDGRYLITLTGVIRFDVAEEQEMRRGYRRVSGDFRRFAADLAPPALAEFDREGLFDTLRLYFSHRGFSANWEAIEAMPDTALVTSLAMACPFDALEKQALLEAENLEERAQTLRALLRIDSHEPPTDPEAGTPPRRLAS